MEMTLSQNFSDREAERIIPIRKYKFVWEKNDKKYSDDVVVAKTSACETI